MFLYIISKLYQIILPCYFGGKFTFASSRISNSMFHSNWADKDKNYKTAMKIFLENTKKPMKITALSGLVAVDFVTFTTICNSAYSLYALIKKVT